MFANYRDDALNSLSRCESGSGAFAGDTLLLCERFSAPKTTWDNGLAARQQQIHKTLTSRLYLRSRNYLRPILEIESVSINFASRVNQST
jgi:hypothetical protein